VSGEEVLLVFPASPLYTAVMLWVPADRALVVHLAVPPLTGSVAQPLIESAPSLKSTLPVGLSPLTILVNVTDWPDRDGFCEEPRLLVDVAVYEINTWPLPE
jgi:hypothetical protein